MEQTVARKVWDKLWANRGWVARILIIVAVVVVLGVGARSCWNRWSSSDYWKSSKEYKDEKAAWDTQRAIYESQLKEKDKVIADAQPKVIAFDALAAQHKAADPKLVEQIEEVSKNEVQKLENAEQPSDCPTRVKHICDLLRARDPKYDCAKLTRESCPQPAGQ